MFGKFLAGLLGGTALGLLFANKKGKTLRDQLKGKNSKEVAEILGKELVDAGKDVGQTVKDLAESEEAQDLKKKATKAVKKAVKDVQKSDEYKEAKKEITKAVKSAKKTAVQTKKKVTKAVKKAVKK